jgi:hypothetical protein
VILTWLTKIKYITYSDSDFKTSSSAFFRMNCVAALSNLTGCFAVVTTGLPLLGVLGLVKSFWIDGFLVKGGLSIDRRNDGSRLLC